MKLSEIVASLAEMKATLAGWVTNKEKATTEAISAFQSKLTGVETGAASELQTANASLTAAQSSLTAEQGRFTALVASIDSAVAALAITSIKADATPLEKVTAMQTAVSTTLAKLNVDPKAVPAPAAQQGAAAADVKTKSRKDFDAMNPKAKAEFMRAGGKLTE